LNFWSFYLYNNIICNFFFGVSICPARSWHMRCRGTNAKKIGMAHLCFSLSIYILNLISEVYSMWQSIQTHVDYHLSCTKVCRIGAWQLFRNSSSIFAGTLLLFSCLFLKGWWKPLNVCIQLIMNLLIWYCRKKENEKYYRNLYVAIGQQQPWKCHISVICAEYVVDVQLYNYSHFIII
jgi:hypothetical protein